MTARRKSLRVVFLCHWHRTELLGKTKHLSMDVKIIFRPIIYFVAHWGQCKRAAFCRLHFPVHLFARQWLHWVQISFKFMHNCPVINKWAFVEVMALHLTNCLQQCWSIFLMPYAVTRSPYGLNNTSIIVYEIAINYGPQILKVITACCTLITASATYMRQWTGSALVEIMACRRFGAKSFSQPLLGYCQLDP